MTCRGDLSPFGRSLTRGGENVAVTKPASASWIPTAALAALRGSITRPFPIRLLRCVLRAPGGRLRAFRGTQLGAARPGVDGYLSLARCDGMAR